MSDEARIEWLVRGEKPEYSPFVKKLTWEEIELLAKTYPEWNSTVHTDIEFCTEEYQKYKDDLRKLADITDFRLIGKNEGQKERC